MGASWSDARDVWEFTYRFVGTGSSQYRDGNPADVIRIAGMEIKGTSNTDNMHLWTSESSKYIGSAPESSGSDEDYSDIATALVSYAITAIESVGASYAWTTAGLIGALLSNVDNTDTTGTYAWRKWEWSSAISDTGQFFWFIVDVEPNETVQISNEYMIFGSGYELLSAGKGYRNLIAGEAPSSTISTSMVKDWNPGMMSEAEKNKYGIEEIPREQFDKRAEELNLPPEIIDEFKNSDEDVFYFAHNFTEGEVNPYEKELSTPKDVLIQEININLERSEKIIKAFSNLESLSDEDLKIIQKHMNRKALLEDLLEKAKLINENDQKISDTLREELYDEILKENPESQI